MSAVCEASCLGFTDVLIGIMSQTCLWLNQTFFFGRQSKIRHRASFGAHDVELSSCFPGNVPAFIPINREDCFFFRCGMFLVTNVRHHSKSSKKMLKRDKFNCGSSQLYLMKTEEIKMKWLSLLGYF